MLMNYIILFQYSHVDLVLLNYTLLVVVGLIVSCCLSVGKSEVALDPLRINNIPEGEQDVSPGVALATCLCCLTIL